VDTVSPRIRLLALVGVLGALAVAGGMFFMSRAPGDAAATQPLPPPAIVKPKPVVATPKQAAAPKQSAVKGKTKATPKPAPKPKAKAKPKRKPRVVAANGLPMTVAAQLAKHRVVVVALYAGGAAIDRMARDEAQAGASDVRVGFAAVDASDKRAIGALTRKVEVLEAPAVFVLGRDGDLLARFDGFADRLMVAQLASSVS
jgi:type IV secretory pathway VirB10-like protein